MLFMATLPSVARYSRMSATRSRTYRQTFVQVNPYQLVRNLHRYAAGCTSLRPRMRHWDLFALTEFGRVTVPFRAILTFALACALH